MKHIKLFENFNRSSIKKLISDDICKKYNITNYTINEDDSIDVDGDVDIHGNELTEIPLKFGKVAGGFYCGDNELTSLKGSPSYVGGEFDCEYNNITSLEGCPQYIGDNFDCRNNKIISFDGSPNFIGGYFYCYENNFNSLKGLKCDITGEFFIEYKLKLIYDILKDNLEYIPNFYDFHILDNLDGGIQTLNLKRLKRFIDLYDLSELSLDQLVELKNYYNII